MDDREKLIDVFMHLDRHIENRDEYGICYTSDFVEAVETVLAMLKNQDANGVTVQQWIPVSERLPEPYTQVIALRTYLLSGDSYPVGLEYIRLCGDANVPAWSGDYATWKNKVTHWMPLPKLSKEV